MRKANTVDLYRSLAAAEHAGAIWSLGHGGDLNANLVRLPAGGGAGEPAPEGGGGFGGGGAEGGPNTTLPGGEGRVPSPPEGPRRSRRGGWGAFAHLTGHRRR